MISSIRLTEHEAALAESWAMRAIARPVKAGESRWPYGGPGDTLNLQDHRGRTVSIARIGTVSYVASPPDELPEPFLKVPGPWWLAELELLHRKGSEALRRSARANGRKGGRKRWCPKALEDEAPEGATVERRGRFVVMSFKGRELKFSTVAGFRTFCRTLLGGR